MGQIIMFFNLGMELKYPDPNKTGILSRKSHGELKATREEMIKLGLIDDPSKSPEHVQLANKYGAIDG